MQDLVHLMLIFINILGGGKYDVLVSLLVEKCEHGGYLVFDQVVEGYPGQPIDGNKFHIVDPVAQLEPHGRILIHVSLSYQ